MRIGGSRVVKYVYTPRPAVTSPIATDSECLVLSRQTQDHVPVYVQFGRSAEQSNAIAVIVTANPMLLVGEWSLTWK